MTKQRFGCGADALVGRNRFRNLVKLRRPVVCVNVRAVEGAGDDSSRILTYFVSSLGLGWGGELMFVVSDALVAPVRPSLVDSCVRVPRGLIRGRSSKRDEDDDRNPTPSHAQ